MLKCWMVHTQARMMKMQLQRMSNVPRGSDLADPMVQNRHEWRKRTKTLHASSKQKLGKFAAEKSGQVKP
jgi:hypothetical protein